MLSEPALERGKAWGLVATSGHPKWPEKLVMKKQKGLIRGKGDRSAGQTGEAQEVGGGLG